MLRLRCYAIGALLAAIASAAAAADRPNVLWITSEDNSPYLGCYGDPLAETPNLDRLAEEGIRFRNAFANAPVCSTARSTLITGTYAVTLGIQHHRSRVRIPDSVRLYPEYLRDAGYYCTNNSKTDYNIADAGNPWDESSRRAHYKNRAAGQPFFAVFNSTTSHESRVAPPANAPDSSFRIPPGEMSLPPFHPDTPTIRRDWAHYYDQVTKMDVEVGALLDELEAAGLAEDTIVVYYSDHGGALPRGKRNIHDSGTRVPLIVRVPDRWSHLATAEPGSWVDQPVSFVDIVASLLNVASVPIPESLDGQPFLGENLGEPRDHVFLYRDRMDERYDMVRAIRDRSFRYVKNYSPHRPWGQFYSYPFQVLPSMRSWHDEYVNGRCDPVQARYWEPKPPEELYEIAADPFEIRDRADGPEQADRLAAMRKALRDELLAARDTGFIPEGMMSRLAGDGTIAEYVQDDDRYPLARIIDRADRATARDTAALPVLIADLSDPHPVIRYWGAVGCLVLKDDAGPARSALVDRLDDDYADVRVAAAEALGHLGEAGAAAEALGEVIANGNDGEVLAALNALDYLVGDGHVTAEKARSLIAGRTFGEPAGRIADRLNER